MLPARCMISWKTLGDTKSKRGSSKSSGHIHYLYARNLSVPIARYQLPNVPETPHVILISGPLLLGLHGPFHGTGLGEHSEGWISVLMCPLVQEATCTTVLYVGDPQSVYRSQRCAGERKETQGHGTWQSRFGLFTHLILPLESGGRELALLGAPDGSVGTALNWAVGRTHGLPTFHGVDLRCFCLLGD